MKYYYTAIAEDKKNEKFVISNLLVRDSIKEDDLINSVNSLWVHLYWDGEGGSLEMKKDNVSDDDMFKLGFYKVKRVSKHVIIEKEHIIYSCL